MTAPANVRSIDALQRLGVALEVFQHEASVALDDLTMDLQRAIQWVEVDQREYWVQELRRAEAAVNEAKLNLSRKKMFRIGDREPACDEEKKALEMAKRRVERAREKLEAVRRWGRLLEREAVECKSGVAPLAQWVETDVPRAVAVLKQLTGALEAYVDVARLDATVEAELATLVAQAGPPPGGQRQPSPSEPATEPRGPTQSQES